MSFVLNSTAPVVPPVFGQSSNADDLQKSSAYDEANFSEGINNLLSGNLDYARTLDLLEREQAFSAAEAQKNREYQKMLSDTSYQRAVADLKAAGFNPALIVGQGGASSPTSAAAFSTSKQAISAGKNATQLLNTLISSAFQLINKVMPSGDSVLKVLGG